MKDLVPFKHYRGMPDLFREMDELFKDFRHGELFAGHGLEKGWVPRMDLSEKKDEYIVTAELPGLEAKDLDISLDGEILTLKGEKKEIREESEEHVHRIERSYGSFSRSLRLPDTVKNNKVDATFKNGVLTITLPKADESMKRVTHVKIH